MQPSKHGAENTNYSPGKPVSFPLLLDEMFSDAIAQQLRTKGHNVQAVVADPSLASLPDDQILAHTAASGRTLVTANIKDLMPLDVRYRAAGQEHAGLILVSAKTFPQNRSYTPAVTSALATLLNKREQIEASQVTFLTALTQARHPAPRCTVTSLQPASCPGNRA
jgi:hypothetical protein